MHPQKHVYYEPRRNVFVIAKNLGAAQEESVTANFLSVQTWVPLLLTKVVRTYIPTGTNFAKSLVQHQSRVSCNCMIRKLRQTQHQRQIRNVLQFQA